MCFGCGWPWSAPVILADPPTKDEVIYLDQNHSFYPDYRMVSEDSAFLSCLSLSLTQPTNPSLLYHFQFLGIKISLHGPHTYSLRYKFTWTTQPAHWSMQSYHAFGNDYPSTFVDPASGF